MSDESKAEIEIEVVPHQSAITLKRNQQGDLLLVQDYENDGNEHCVAVLACNVPALIKALQTYSAER